MTTQGFFLSRIGDASSAFELKEFELRAIQDAEVLIEVEAFGLNYADVMARKGLYQGAPPMPCVLGYEVVGIVIKASAENNHLTGKRVMAFCRFGGYAKHVITTVDACVEVRDEPAGELLALCTQGVTAYYMAEYLISLHKTDKVLIHAASGGVGTILIQLAKRRGAFVIAKVGSNSKIDLAQRLGADLVVNYNTSDYIEQINRELGEDKIDVSFNPVAGASFRKDLSIIGPGGRIILFGASALGKGKWGILSKLNFVRKMGVVIPVGLMMSSRSILGVNMLNIADQKPEVLKECLSEVYKLYEQAKLSPQIGGEYKSTDLATAHAALESGLTTGKLAIFW